MNTEEFNMVKLETDLIQFDYSDVVKVRKFIELHDKLITDYLSTVMQLADQKAVNIFIFLKQLMAEEQAISLDRYRKYAVSLKRDEHMEIIRFLTEQLGKQLVSKTKTYRPGGKVWGNIREIYLKDRSFVQTENLYRR